MIAIQVNAQSALARFSPAGIPEQVRRNLRATIPGLLRSLAAEVNRNLDSGLKSRARVQIDKGQGEMVENARGITGRMEMIWTGDPSASMVPQVLESGARPHVIEAKNAGALYFYWPVVGANVFFRKVNHPGFPGIRYMQNAFEGMKSEIVGKLEESVKDGARE